MREILVLYAFVGLMALNLLTSFIYLVGFHQLRLHLRRAWRTARSARSARAAGAFAQKPR